LPHLAKKKLGDLGNQKNWEKKGKTQTPTPGETIKKFRGRGEKHFPTFRGGTYRAGLEVTSHGVGPRSGKKRYIHGLGGKGGGGVTDGKVPAPRNKTRNCSRRKKAGANKQI